MSKSVMLGVLREVACKAAFGATSLVAAGFFTQAQASDVTWGGTYRVEATKVVNPELSSAQSNKAYLLHHLILTPKIQAADGLTINSRLDVFNDPNFGIDGNGRVYSVAGDLLGGGPNQSIPSNTSTTTNANDSNALSRTQRAGTFAITELYANWNQEFGQFVVGRVPMQFGLGTAYNAGNGQFDHFIDTKDMIGYKAVLGNLYIFPMLGKANEGVVGQEDDVNDYVVQVGYDNPETDLSLGFLYQMRVYTFAGNDLPTGSTNLGGVNAVRGDGGKSTLMGFFMSQHAGPVKVGIEADLLSGDTGLKNTSSGNNVSLNSFGIASEVSYKPADSKMSSMLKLGMASGDDPGTNDTNEGFIFSRNYDVAMLLFNHPLGQANILRTGLIRNTSATVNSQIDNEGLSNAIYLSPSFQYQWKENFSYGANLVYAVINKDPIASGNTAGSLGTELDFNLTYKPYERLTWITQAGFLFPGDAWKAGTANNFETKFAYGLVTKAAITF